MKRLLFTILLFTAALPAAPSSTTRASSFSTASATRPRCSPTPKWGAVEVKTSEVQLDDRKFYKVEGIGRTLPTYRWFFNLEDIYTVWISPETLRPVRFESDLQGGRLHVPELLHLRLADNDQVHTRWRRRQRPFEEKTMPLTPESMDAIALFFTMRSANAEDFKPGEPATLQMVLQDTIRHLNYRYISRETKKIRNMGRFKTLKFECQLGTSEGFSFTDGTVFTLWISDDENKIPLYIESPVRVGSINAYISGYKGLKYPMTSLIK